MRQNNAGCLTGLIAGFSRLMLLMYWIARPVAMDAMFSSFLVPCLGFFLLPFTTVMYILLQSSAVGGLQGLDWLWIGLAVVLDLASIAGAGYSNRDRLPANFTGSTPQSY